MAGEAGDRGSLWVDGQFTVRLRGPGPEPGRIVRIRRPFALIGQIPGADLRIDDPAVDGRHALLVLDARGVFGVDLLSRTGTRFAGAEAASSWLGAGDILEVAGRRVELLRLQIDGQAVNPPLADDDLLVDAPGLIGLELEPLDAPGPPWRVGSALAFVGRGEACAIRIEHASASLTHCALFRTVATAHVIDLLGRRTMVNGRDVEGASDLLDGDILTVGGARFGVKLGSQEHHQFFHPSSDHAIEVMALDGTPDVGPGRGMAIDPRTMMMSLLLDAAGAGRDPATGPILEALRQFQADTATLFEAQIDRIEAMNREIASLRDEVRDHLGPPPVAAEPLQLDLIPPPVAPPAGESAGWLLDRLNTLETESRSTWKDLLGKIAATVTPRTPAQPSQSLVPARTCPPGDAPV